MGDAPAQPPARYEWVDVAKAFAILLVVLSHVATEFRFVGVHSAQLAYLLDLFETMRMPLFFCASGLFAASWLRRGWRELFAGRLAVLVWVFLLWQPAVFAAKLIAMWLLPNQPESTLLSQVLRVLVSPVRPNGELWFLWALVLSFMLAKLMGGLSIWIRLGVPILVSILWLGPAQLLIGGEALRLIGAGWEGLFAYFAFFVIGAAVTGPVRSFFNRAGYIPLLAILVVWSGSYLVLNAAGLRNALVIGFVLRLLGIASGFALAVLLSRVRLLQWIGRHTLPIYVAHVLIITVLVALLYGAGLTEAASSVPIAAELGLLVFATAAALGVWALARRAAPWRYLYEVPPSTRRRLAPPPLDDVGTRSPDRSVDP